MAGGPPRRLLLGDRARGELRQRHHVQALQALRCSTPFLDPRLRKLLDQQAPCRLTGRERQTLEGLARGGSNRSIAAALSIAPATVRDYVSSLCRKLAAANRTEVVSRAIAMGLIEP